MSWPEKILLSAAGLFALWTLAAWVWGGWLLLRQWWNRFVLGRKPEPVPPLIDGFGQTLAQDLAYQKRFRACKKQEVLWRAARDEEQKVYDAHPTLGRFADFTIAVAEVDGRTWIVRERLFHGWPDPPEWVFFAMSGEEVWAAGDFDHWPRRWKEPEKVEAAM